MCFGFVPGTIRYKMGLIGPYLDYCAHFWAAHFLKDVEKLREHPAASD